MPKEPYFKSNKHVANHVTVDMGNQKLNKVGANLSSRFPLGVESETGNISYGFFTKNTYVNNARPLFKRYFQSSLENKNNKKYEEIFNIFFAASTNNNMLTNTQDWYKYGLLIKEDTLAGNVGKLDGKTITTIVENKPVRKAKMISFLANQGVSRDLLDKEKDNKEFWQYLGDMLASAHSASFLASANFNAHRLQLGENINKRNNAMYDYAVLLHENDLVCKSSSMTVLKDGEQLEGSFMINAKGTDYSRLDPNAPGMNGRRIVMTAEAVKSISKLQILDFLCANVDRHPGNMFYQLDTTSDPNVIKLTGVQGIDNDASFGNHAAYPQNNPGQRAAGYLSYIADIQVIDKSMADMVLNLSTEELDVKIRLAGLSATEIDFAHQRLAALQQKITQGKVKILSDNDWKKYENPAEYNKLAFSFGSTYNIFDNAFYAIDEYNKKPFNALNNQQNPEQKQVPVGKAKGTFENNLVDVHKNEINHIFRLFSEPAYTEQTNKLINPPAGYKEICSSIKSLTKYMDGIAKNIQNNVEKDILAGKDVITFTLTDMQRNILLEEIKNLKNKTDSFAKTGSEQGFVDESGAHVNSNYTKLLVNNAKNLSAYLNFASQSIKEDAIEAEKNLASKLSFELSEKPPVNKYDDFIIEFKKLKDTVNGLNSPDAYGVYPKIPEEEISVLKQRYNDVLRKGSTYLESIKEENKEAEKENIKLCNQIQESLSKDVRGLEKATDGMTFPEIMGKTRQDEKAVRKTEADEIREMKEEADNLVIQNMSPKDAGQFIKSMNEMMLQSGKDPLLCSKIGSQLETMAKYIRTNKSTLKSLGINQNDLKAMKKNIDIGRKANSEINAEKQSGQEKNEPEISKLIL